MTIAVGDKLPNATLFETTEFGEACPVGPQTVSVAEAAAGKGIVLFGLPGAFTQTCSTKHVPGYLEHFEALRAKGVDEVWCVSVNDAYVMAEWGRSQNAIGKIRFIGDPMAQFATALGLEVTIPGLGVRFQRCSMWVEDLQVKILNVEKPRAFEVSDAATILSQLSAR